MKKFINYEVIADRLNDTFMGYRSVAEDSPLMRDLERQGKIRITPIEGQSDLFGEEK